MKKRVNVRKKQCTEAAEDPPRVVEGKPNQQSQQLRSVIAGPALTSTTVRRLVDSNMEGCECIGTVPSIGFSNGALIEVYDIAHPSYVGVIHPDGACMISPRAHFSSKKLGPPPEGETYSEKLRNIKREKLRSKYAALPVAQAAQPTKRIRVRTAINTAASTASAKRKRVQLRGSK